MIAPASLAELIEADPVTPLKSAIVQRFGDLLPGVKVISHPGRVDISDIVARSVVAAPGVAVGWSRIRPQRRPDGGWQALCDFAAYVVVEDSVVAGRRVEREIVGRVIGQRLVAALSDPDESLFGRPDVLPPEAIDFKPLFTVRDMAQGAAYYAVTWTQAVVEAGDGHWSDLPVARIIAGTAPGDDVIAYASEADLVAAMDATGFGQPLEGWPDIPGDAP